MAEKLAEIAGSSLPLGDKIEAALDLLHWFESRAREFHKGDWPGFLAEMGGLYARLEAGSETEDDVAGDLIDLVLAELCRRGFAPKPA
ncbi:hypothetical protein SLNSH_02790 [Alsobacter soli]|uniref:Uncharacterized protein n=1 Tax=Alsobacter soli TaxID=2109933 RepID=A0A2T1HYR8_9HYPH|nr:hypothetical protein [Alsobacter soli]PSC06740.1 hypothetical protein SLNSH_02790 [Alsobacter soli]